jgi:hypothetical protein
VDGYQIDGMQIAMRYPQKYEPGRFHRRSGIAASKSTETFSPAEFEGPADLSEFEMLAVPVDAALADEVSGRLPDRVIVRHGPAVDAALADEVGSTLPDRVLVGHGPADTCRAARFGQAMVVDQAPGCRMGMTSLPKGSLSKSYVA